MNRIYKTKEEIIKRAEEILGFTLRNVINNDTVSGEIEDNLKKQGSNRKGYYGELVEEMVFNQKPNTRNEADFPLAGIELKTTPLKKDKTKKFSSKERLVFSKINYGNIVEEEWASSSFLKKNNFVLILFYLYEKEIDLLDYIIKYKHELDFINGISAQDVLQIQKDWEFIVNKIKRGEAHLLSEGDTYYLGACTKAKDSSVTTSQPNSEIPAKPRAFSFKQKYLNYIVQTKVLNNKDEEVKPISSQNKTIDEIVVGKLNRYIGKTDKEIVVKLKLKDFSINLKQYRRMLVNRMLGAKTSRIEEFEKSNVELRVVALEPTGILRESISFPKFEYKDIVKEDWETSEFRSLLEERRFLFIIFQKIKDSEDIIFKNFKFWNFPMNDIGKVKDVWEETKKLIKAGNIVKEIKKDKNGKEKKLTYFPGKKFNGIAHVRPHARNGADTTELPVRDRKTGLNKHTKSCFWLNSEYIRNFFEN